MIKKVFSLLFCCAILFLPLKASAAGGALQYFGVSFTIAESGFTYDTVWWLPENDSAKEYYLTVPYNADVVTAKFGATGDVFLDGTEIENGQELNFVYGQKYTVSCGAGNYTVIPLRASGIPQIFISTVTPVNLEHKSAKTNGNICIIDTEGNYVYNGELDEIKGRGNATWNFSKKPFNIKLGEKTDIFGLGKSKKFSLLANYIDDTLIKNKLISDFANSIGLDFNSKSEIVDLFVNGNYFGNYTLIERVEVGENRVEINELEKQNEDLNENIPPEDAELGGERGNNAGRIAGSYKYSLLENNPEDITGGYLLEYELWERYGDESSGFVTDYGQPIIVKSPEYASKEQVEYIRNYYQEFEDAVLSADGKNHLGKHYSDYLDVESMAKMYVLQEFVKNLDAGQTSFYLYKDINGKLVASPVWDFDSSLGRKYFRYGQDLADPNGLWATDLLLYGLEDQNKKTIISLLCSHADFRELAAEQWEEHFEPYIGNIVDTIDNMTDSIYDSAIIDKTRWNVESTSDGLGWSDREAADTAQWYDDSVKALKNFITKRREFLSPVFDVENNYIQYSSNGGEGVMSDYSYYSDGYNFTVPECEFTNSDQTKSFMGWNTKPNGWGVQYMPGDEIVLKDSITLYAQWEEQDIIAKIASFFSNMFN